MSTEVSDPYAHLSAGYGDRRRPDPRIAALIHDALGDAGTVVNVGAGAGSYEPVRPRVVAVEPSASMLAQRPPGTAPAVRVVAEALPLPDDAADAALAVLTVHHWSDPSAGLGEMARVAARQVVLTWDPAVLRRFWLVAHYVPAVADLELRLATLDAVVDGLGAAGHVDVLPVPVPSDCTDGFLGAYWRRPHAYLDPAARAAMSGLARLPASTVTPAMARLAADLDDGTWHARHGALFDAPTADLGYRLVVAAR